MIEVYELELNDQRDPHNYGLFSSLKKVETFLVDTLRVDIGQKLSYDSTIFYYSASGDYVVKRRSVT
jgi:hypothetical protein